MSNYTLKRKEVVARKEYVDDCRPHFETGIINQVDGKWTVDIDEAKLQGITDESDIAIIQDACDRNWMIKKGEKHIYVEGKYDGEFYCVRLSIWASEILDKYDLWYED